MGVGHHLSPLQLVAHQLLRPGAVRVGHRDQLPAVPDKCPVAGEQAAAILLVKRRKAVKVKRCRRPPPGQPSQHRSVHRGQQIGQLPHIPVAVHPGQKEEGLHLPPGCVLQGGVAVPSLRQRSIGALHIAQAVPEPVTQSLVSLPPQQVEELRIGLQGLRSTPLGQTAHQGPALLHHRRLQ